MTVCHGRPFWACACPSRPLRQKAYHAQRGSGARVLAQRLRRPPCIVVDIMYIISLDSHERDSLVPMALGDRLHPLHTSPYGERAIVQNAVDHSVRSVSRVRERSAWPSATELFHEHRMPEMTQRQFCDGFWRDASLFYATCRNGSRAMPDHGS